MVITSARDGWSGQGRGSPSIASDFLESQASVDVDGVFAGEGLPTPDRDIDVTRIDFDRAGLPADPFGREQRRAGATEGIEHNVVALGAVLDCIGDHVRPA